MSSFPAPTDPSQSRRSTRSSAANHADNNAEADLAYCHFISRRAVARAALHLGIGTMTAESVDALAGCLLEYLERVGATVGATAEAAGRSSQHCHILDAVRATELCTGAAAAVVQEGGAGAGGVAGEPYAAAAAAAETNPEPGAAASKVGEATVLASASWKDLAAFCFGPDWDQQPEEDEASPAAAAAGALFLEGRDPREPRTGAGAGGGKVGPSASVADVLQDNDRNNIMSGARHKGWMAPYPEEIPPFPICRPQVANPHPMVREPALHDAATTILEEGSEAKQTIWKDDTPDAVFQINHTTAVGWGGLDGTTTTEHKDKDREPAVGEKRKANDDGGGDDEAAEPPTKRVKFAAAAEATTQDGVVQRRPSLPSYVPSFYPPFPSHLESRPVVDTTISTAAAAAVKRSTQQAATAAAASLTTNNGGSTTAATASTRPSPSAPLWSKWVPTGDRSCRPTPPLPIRWCPRVGLRRRRRRRPRHRSCPWARRAWPASAVCSKAVWIPTWRRRPLSSFSMKRKRTPSTEYPLHPERENRIFKTKKWCHHHEECLLQSRFPHCNEDISTVYINIYYSFAKKTAAAVVAVSSSSGETDSAHLEDRRRTSRL